MTARRTVVPDEGIDSPEDVVGVDVFAEAINRETVLRNMYTGFAADVIHSYCGARLSHHLGLVTHTTCNLAQTSCDVRHIG